MNNSQYHGIPEAILNYAYVLFGKAAFRERLRVRGKG